MMPICPPRTDAGGFTLIEMLVVLSIAGLLAAMMAPRLGGRPDGVARGEAAARMEAAIASASRGARSTGGVSRLRPAAVVPGARLVEATFPSQGGEPSLLLYPDGSSSGGVIALEGRALLKVDWVTGVVSRD